MKNIAINAVVTKRALNSFCKVVVQANLHNDNAGGKHEKGHHSEGQHKTLKAEFECQKLMTQSVQCEEIRHGLQFTYNKASQAAYW